MLLVSGHLPLPRIVWVGLIKIRYLLKLNSTGNLAHYKLPLWYLNTTSSYLLASKKYIHHHLMSKYIFFTKYYRWINRAYGDRLVTHFVREGKYTCTCGVPTGHGFPCRHIFYVKRYCNKDVVRVIVAAANALLLMFSEEGSSSRGCNCVAICWLMNILLNSMKQGGLWWGVKWYNYYW